MKESRFKKGDKLVAFDMSYWGPKYNHSDVTVESEQHPVYYVHCYDGIVRRASFHQLKTFEDFYTSKHVASAKCPDLDWYDPASTGWMASDKGEDDDKPEVELPKCICDMTALMRYGCRCGGV